MMVLNLKNHICLVYWMNVTYLLGNGFDINLGLHTQYNCFLDYYKKQDHDYNNRVISQFKEKNERKEVWSDLEKNLGYFVSYFETEDVNDIESFIFDIQDSLSKYLIKEDVDFSLQTIIC